MIGVEMGAGKNFRLKSLASVRYSAFDRNSPAVRPVG